MARATRVSRVNVAVGAATFAAIFSGFIIGGAVRSEGAPGALDRESASATAPTSDPGPSEIGGVPDLKLAFSDFPKNSSGLTYGSDATVTDPSEGPDLVAVMADSGIAGFAYADALAGPVVNTPDEAARYEEQITRDGGYKVAVFEVDGKNRIGTMTLGLGETRTEPAH